MKYSSFNVWSEFVLKIFDGPSNIKNEKLIITNKFTLKYKIVSVALRILINLLTLLNAHYNSFQGKLYAKKPIAVLISRQIDQISLFFKNGVSLWLSAAGDTIEKKKFRYKIFVSLFVFQTQQMVTVQAYDFKSC